MTDKQILRNQTIAIANMTIQEMQDHAQNISMSQLSDRVKKDLYRIIDKAVEILQSETENAMAVSSNIREAS